MKKILLNVGSPEPTANLTLKKSRLKIYNKETQIPTYYLKDGQEFEIELFNPTTDTVLAKVSLNNTEVTQGGIILRPGQRIFLERYLDEAKKFLFETYEVSASEEVKKAIKFNGDVKVQFFKERKPVHVPIRLGGLQRPEKLYPWDPNHINKGIWFGQPYSGGYVHSTPTNLNDYVNGVTTTGGLAGGSVTTSYSSGEVTMDSFTTSSASLSMPINATYLNQTEPQSKSLPNNLKGVLRSKSIETGRVEKGSHSDQQFKEVDMDFEYFAFHTVEYKLLPESQKVNTAGDLMIKKHCTNCGAKLGKTDKFCSQCGTKV